MNWGQALFVGWMCGTLQTVAMVVIGRRIDRKRARR